MRPTRFPLRKAAKQESRVACPRTRFDGESRKQGFPMKKRTEASEK
jgi:hypothetical protein